MNIKGAGTPKIPKMGLRNAGQPRLRTLKRMLMKPTGGGAMGGGGFLPIRPSGG